MSQTFTSFADFRQRYPIRPGDEGALLGSGSYGKVLKVEDQVETEWVAIKISEFKGNDARSLRAEVELAQKVPRQANIARYDACYRLETDTGVNDFAIMKYYPDGNLADLLRSVSLTRVQINSITEGILLGLKHLHQNRIVHRDFKPANILISRDNQGRFIPKIADFGLSKMVREEEIDSSDFDLSDGRGTPSYKAPEQIEGGRVSFNLDLWAFGVILYEMMTGEKPFSVYGRTGTESSLKREIELKIVTVETPAKLDEIAEPYQTMIRRCLVRDIRQRVRREDELLDLLHGRIAPGPRNPMPTLVAEATDIWIEQQIDLGTDMYTPSTPVAMPRPAPVPAPKAQPKMPAPVRTEVPAGPVTAAAQKSAEQSVSGRRTLPYMAGVVLAVALIGGIWFATKSNNGGQDRVVVAQTGNTTAVADEPHSEEGAKARREESYVEKASPKLAAFMNQARSAYNRQDYKACMNELDHVLTIDSKNAPAKRLYRAALKNYREHEQRPNVVVEKSAEPVAKVETEPANTDRVAEKQADYDKLIQEGVAAISTKNDKAGATSFFNRAHQLANLYELNTDKANSAYQTYLTKGNRIMENGEYEGAKTWFLVAQSLRNTAEVRSKIKECNSQ